jgi:hypothetical protein
VTPAEKIYAFVVMISAKIFVAFIYAAAASLVSDYTAAYTRHMQKESTMRSWMTHTKLPYDLQLRVSRYYELIWNTLQGQNDSETFNELPGSLETDIRLEIFN